MAEVENHHATRRDVPNGIATIIAAVIGVIGGIIVAVIGILPMRASNAEKVLQDEVAVLQAEKSALEAEKSDLKAENDVLNWKISHYDFPEDSKVWNGHRYWVSQGPDNWNKAQELCNALGGHLVTITSADEQEYIEKYVGSQAPDSVHLWIGLKANNGHWNEWITHEALDSFSHWNEAYSKYSVAGGNYGAFCNFKYGAYYITVYNGSGEIVETVRVDAGKWLGLDDKGTSWLICEWDFA